MPTLVEIPKNLRGPGGGLWSPEPDVLALFVCREHGCELERAETYWVCPATLDCKAVPEGLLLERLVRLLTEGTGTRADLERAEKRAWHLLRKMRRRCRWLWTVDDPEQYRPTCAGA